MHRVRCENAEVLGLAEQVLDGDGRGGLGLRNVWPQNAYWQRKLDWSREAVGSKYWYLIDLDVTIGYSTGTHVSQILTPSSS